MIDSHCHLDFESYDSIRDEVLKTANNFGVNKIVNPGSDFESNFKAAKLSEKYDNYFFAVGMHPDTTTNDPENLYVNKVKEIEDLITHKKCVAIGEIGLDYHGEGYDKEKQKDLFITQLEYAKKYNKHIIIHNRDAVQDIYDILKQYSLIGVIHCYSEDKEWAKKFLDLGYNISFTGIVTFKNCKQETIDAVKYIPLDRMFVETDSPYLTPTPFRGELNKPEYVRFVAEKIAEIKGVSVKEVEEITDRSFEKFFEI